MEGAQPSRGDGAAQAGDVTPGGTGDREATGTDGDGDAEDAGTDADGGGDPPIGAQRAEVIKAQLYDYVNRVAHDPTTEIARRGGFSKKDRDKGGAAITGMALKVLDAVSLMRRMSDPTASERLARHTCEEITAVFESHRGAWITPRAGNTRGRVSVGE